MKPMLEELRRGLRFLADLRLVFPHLTETERSEIVEARVRKDRFHERLVRENAEEVLVLARQIKSFKYRRLKDDIVKFIDECEMREPDQLKVFVAQLNTEIAA